ncbi:universal stress protein [Belnapia rosea]|uniref:universal stress protein n=1 Tax=Belnapia rosea TaxID=938405 RepID=UPI000880959E|nr:universal stress protein [Belnapia rosea]SDB57316.1 Nucleotide-binding universal stress protein, UspA family [Belnapia rosea]
MSTIATILVHAESDLAASGRLRLATGLARRFDASLTGFAAGDPVIPMLADAAGADGRLIAQLLDEAEARVRAELAKAERSFRAAAAPLAEAQCEWGGFLASPVAALLHEAAAADLVIIGRAQANGEQTDLVAPNPGDVLMQAGRPVLVVPPEVETLTARRIVLAWKESREARRAAADALPFLVQAEQVLLLEITDRGATTEELATAQIRLEGVARWLGRHGVAAIRSKAIALRAATVPEELQQAAEALRADLIVAGGYGHSRLREWVFGGVTRALLQQSPLCCLLSH